MTMYDKYGLSMQIGSYDAFLWCGECPEHYTDVNDMDAALKWVMSHEGSHHLEDKTGENK